MSETLDFTPDEYRAWLEETSLTYCGTDDPLASFINAVLGYSHQLAAGCLLHDGFQPGRTFPWVALPEWTKPLTRKYQAHRQYPAVTPEQALRDLDEALAHEEPQP